ncbi:MAG: hypothetical protein AAF399_24590 [Bacteroidota bacterium]
MTSIMLDYAQLPAMTSREQAICAARMNRFPQVEGLRCLHEGDDLSTYSQMLEEVQLPFPLAEVWQTYTGQTPEQMWKGPMVRYLFGYDRQEKRHMYAGQEQGGKPQPGQLFFCLLSVGVPIGLVVMELLRLDPERHELELAYVEGGLYRGVQQLSFQEENGQTRVKHVSYYRGESAWVRGLVPYAYLHSKTAGEFHGAMQRKLHAQ